MRDGIIEINAAFQSNPTAREAGTVGIARTDVRKHCGVIWARIASVLASLLRGWQGLFSFPSQLVRAGWLRMHARLRVRAYVQHHYYLEQDSGERLSAYLHMHNCRSSAETRLPAGFARYPLRT